MLGAGASSWLQGCAARLPRVRHQPLRVAVPARTLRLVLQQRLLVPQKGGGEFGCLGLEPLEQLGAAGRLIRYGLMCQQQGRPGQVAPRLPRRSARTVRAMRSSTHSSSTMRGFVFRFPTCSTRPCIALLDLMFRSIKCWLKGTSHRRTSHTKLSHQQSPGRWLFAHHHAFHFMQFKTFGASPSNRNETLCNLHVMLAVCVCVWHQYVACTQL